MPTSNRRAGLPLDCMSIVTYRPIGVIHSPFKSLENMPIQPTAAGGAEGRVELLPEFEEGVEDLAGFSHIILICHLHLSNGCKLQVTPFLDDQLRGLFSTRAPRRPNPIGLSVVRLVAVNGCTLRIRDVDMVDGTPLLDIKPYVPDFEPGEKIRIGWLSPHRKRIRDRQSDGRFLDGQRGP